MSVWVGTSGWQYADWRGAFYPEGLPQKAWLPHYAAEFDTVEINSTFYRLPKQAAAANWASTVPDGFRFVVKASRYLTHIKRLREPAEPVARLLDRIAPLRTAGRLGAVLIQLPPDLPAEIERLDETMAEFPSDVPLAIEPREPTWFAPPLQRLLEARGAALVWADRYGESLGPLWQTADWAYLRLHHGRRDWGYDDRDLRSWAGRLPNNGWVFCNNDPGCAAIRDARRLRELLGQAPTA